MFDTNEILARLQNGEDAQKIADEMAKMLNDANAQHKAIQEKAKAEAEAKAQAEKRNVQKREDLQEILDLFMAWFDTYYGIKDAEINVDDVLELIDSLNELTLAFNGLEQRFAKPAKAPVKKVIKTGNPDQVINDFLKNMGW